MKQSACYVRGPRHKLIHLASIIANLLYSSVMSYRSLLYTQSSLTHCKGSYLHRVDAGGCGFLRLQDHFGGRKKKEGDDSRGEAVTYKFKQFT